jgi:uncharacterized membrane protein
MQLLTNALDTWASIYANSAAIRTTIGFMHVGGLVAGGGCAIAADRTTLMSVKREISIRTMQLENVRNVHRIVIAGLFLVTVSGLLLFAADSENFIHSKLFWLKMGLFAMLLTNGGFFALSARQAEQGNEQAWKRLVLASIISIGLWFLTTLAGTALLNIG